jgi:hypothetical protein
MEQVENDGEAQEETTMAQYKYAQYLQQSQHVAFDEVHTPGTVAVNSGIYRCESCGDEIAANKGNPLPPQNHHQHAPTQAAIRWKLIMYAAQR